MEFEGVGPVVVALAHGDVFGTGFCTGPVHYAA